MNQQQIIEVQIRKLENEIINAHAERVSRQMQVEDAATPTGNTHADARLKNDGEIAANTLFVLDRMIATRQAKCDALTAQLAALNAASPATAPAPRPADPPVA